jgi:transcriptional regulator with XRE-family HTH domain
MLNKGRQPKRSRVPDVFIGFTPSVMTADDLACRRNVLDLSVNGLARVLGVTPGAVSLWENDKRQIPPYLDLALQTLERAAMTDDTPEPDLQRTVEEMAPADDRSLTVADPSPALRWLIETAQQLPDEDLTLVTDLAQRLLTFGRRWDDTHRES